MTPYQQNKPCVVAYNPSYVRVVDRRIGVLGLPGQKLKTLPEK
jgi:hypothetical protein